MSIRRACLRFSFLSSYQNLSFILVGSIWGSLGSARLYIAHISGVDSAVPWTAGEAVEAVGGQAAGRCGLRCTLCSLLAACLVAGVKAALGGATGWRQNRIFLPGPAGGPRDPVGRDYGVADYSCSHKDVQAQ